MPDSHDDEQLKGQFTLKGGFVRHPLQLHTHTGKEDLIDSINDKSGAFERILNGIKPENKLYVDYSISIAAEIVRLLARHNTIKSPQALAKALGISKDKIKMWFSGYYNFTIEDLAKLTSVLGEIITIGAQQNSLCE